MNNKSNFSVIGARYLDTQHDDAYIDSLEAELQKRGVTGVYRWFLEYIAASSLWWNIIWWDWVDLNEEDIRIGWVLNLVLFGLVAVVSGYVLGMYAGVAAFFVLHVFTTWFGFSLRSCTKANS